MQELKNHPSIRRQRQIQRKRQEILNAATRVFSEKGYASTTTKDIANAADIGESTLYSYFQGKREVLLAIFEDNRQIFDVLSLKSSAVANRESLAELFEKSMELISSHVRVTRAVMAEAWVDDQILDEYVLKRLVEIAHILENYIKGQIAAGVFREFDPALGARLAMGLFFSLVLPALRGVEHPPDPEERRRLSEAVVSLMLDGIRTREGESPRGMPC